MAFCTSARVGHPERGLLTLPVDFGGSGGSSCCDSVGNHRRTRSLPKMAFWVTDGPDAAGGERSMVLGSDAGASGAGIRALKTIEEYESRLVDGQGCPQDDATVRVVKISAAWCRSCKAAKRKVEKVVAKYSDVEFYELDFGEHQEYCATELGVDVLPHFEIFVGSKGRKESFPCGWNQIYSKLDETIERYRESGSSDTESV